MLWLVLLTWGRICVRLNSDWALTEGDYARLAPQLRALSALLSPEFSRLATAAYLNWGVKCSPDPGWDEVKTKWPQNPETWEFPMRHFLSQGHCKTKQKKSFPVPLLGSFELTSSLSHQSCANWTQNYSKSSHWSQIRGKVSLGSAEAWCHVGLGAKHHNVANT